MKVYFITALNFLDPTRETSNCELTRDGLRVVTDYEIIGKHKKQWLISKIGQLEWTHLESAKAWGYAELDFPTAPADDVCRRMTAVYLQCVQNWTHSLWITRDNSVYAETGFLFVPQLYIHSNVLTDIICTSRGSRGDVKFSDGELASATARFRERVLPTFIGGSCGEANLPSKDLLFRPYLAQYEALSVVSRCFGYIGYCRRTRDLGQKIAFYCTCLEVLFSTDNQELKHKVAERVAWFVGRDPDERIALYKLISKAYSTRSTVFHGDSISKKEKELVLDRSAAMDDLLRRVIDRILASNELVGLFSMNKEKRNEWLLEMTMGAANQALQTTPMARSVYEKTTEFGRPQRGV